MKSSSASLTEAGPNSEPNAGVNGQQRLDRVDAINQVFAEFEFAYHNQFHKAFANPESLAIAKKYWLSSLERYSPEQIVHAAKQVIRTQDYLPSIAVILRACEQGLDLFGLPDPRQAYLEASGAPSPKHSHNWSHQAVYHAGRAAGWFLLATEPEAVAFPVFEYHYAQLCQQVINGEELSINQPQALPETVERRLDKQEVQARIQQLRKELDL
jgi:hypothetical protein